LFLEAEFFNGGDFFMNKKICLTTFLAFSAPAFAQDRPEHMEVSGSRIPSEAFGVIAGAPSPGEPTHGCAEPNCGESPQDPGGASAVTQKQKSASNKKAREKAKEKKPAIAENMKQDKPAWQKMLEWMSGVNLGLDGVFRGYFRVKTKDVEVEAGGCVKYKADLNKNNPGASAETCVERRLDAVPVLKENGVLENQLELSYAIYEPCVWDKACRVEYITFIAGSPEELRSFINETVGESVL
jgi:hypothetical protein